jgi:hypothetical protein
MSNLVDFEKLIKESNKEFIEKRGLVTAEFSTSEEDVLKKLKILADNMFELDDIAGVWSMFPCETCKGYHEDRPLHVILIPSRSLNDRKSSYELSMLQKKVNGIEEENSGMSKKIKENIVMSKEDFKEVVNIAMLKYEHDIVNNIPESLLYFSEKADRIKL